MPLIGQKKWWFPDPEARHSHIVPDLQRKHSAILIDFQLVHQWPKGTSSCWYWVVHGNLVRNDFSLSFRTIYTREKKILISIIRRNSPRWNWVWLLHTRFLFLMLDRFLYWSSIVKWFLNFQNQTKILRANAFLAPLQYLHPDWTTQPNVIKDSLLFNVWRIN